jgi:hypothetical protein
MARTTKWIATGETAVTLAGLDPKLIPSVAEQLRGLTTVHVAASDISAAAKALEPFRTMTVASAIAESLKDLQLQPASSFAEAVKGLQTSPAFHFTKLAEGFGFAKAVEGLDTTAFAQSLSSLQLPRLATAELSTLTAAVTALPSVDAEDLASDFDQAAEESVALAEVEDVAEILDRAVGLSPRLAAMTPAQRRALALDFVVLIAAYLLLAARMRHSMDEMKDPEGFASLLILVTAFVRVYWRLIGKIS